MIQHNLIPKHELTSPEEAQEILDKYEVEREQLPKIFITDPAIEHLETKVGDIIKITRENKNIGKSQYYRVVIE